VVVVGIGVVVVVGVVVVDGSDRFGVAVEDEEDSKSLFSRKEIKYKIV
jgi:hypothetical protein